MLGVLLLVYSAILAYAAVFGPFPAFVPLGSPTAYRSLYIHVPQSVAALAMAFASFLSSIWFLKRGGARARVVMHRSAELAAVLSWLSFATGSIWAQESWGAAWSGDPRQLSVAVVAVLYTGYVFLRRAVEDPDRLDRISASYLVLVFISVPVTLVAPVLLPALHPAPGSLAELTTSTRLLYIAVFAVLLAVAVLYVLGARAGVAWGVASFVVLAGAAAWLLSGYTHPVYRVYNATLTDSTVVLYTSGGVLKLPAESIHLRPLEIGGVPTLKGHLITADGVVVSHWSVAANLLATGLAVVLITLLSKRRL